MENHALDVVTCGELLIDFVALEEGATLTQASLFKKAAGGAPANVAVGMARLGQRVGFLGQVGDDEFGYFLAETLQSNGIDITGLHFSTQARTALAFVSLLAHGERDFMFYRHPGADMLWCAEEVDQAYIARARVLHYGSISLIHEPSRSATLTALAYAKNNDVLLSYDPNLRLSLWPSADAARAGILKGWQHAHVIKVSQEELAFLSAQDLYDSHDTLEHAAYSLWHEHLRLLVVTQGKEGCSYFTPDTCGHVPGFAVVSKDTTGAGDSFVAGMLTGLLEGKLVWEKNVIEHALLFANAAGALATTQVGAIPSLPTMVQVQAFLQRTDL